MATDNPSPSIVTTSFGNGLRLGIVSCFCLILVIIAYFYATPIIEKNKREHELHQLKAVLPQHLYQNDLLNDSIMASVLDSSRKEKIYVARDGSGISGFVFPISTQDGYSGQIDLIIGIDVNGTIQGVRVINHRETPGLGDKIDIKKSNWIEGFNGKSIGNPEEKEWAVHQDGGVFDSFTGATITPRAVVKVVRRGLESYQKNKQEWFIAATPSDTVNKPSTE